MKYRQQASSLKKNRIFGAGPAIPYTHPKLLRASHNLRKQNQFYITESDNGGVVVLWNWFDYEKEALRQLGDSANYHLVADENYFKLSGQSTPQIIQRLTKKLCDGRNAHIHKLKRNGYISHKESKAMQVIDENQKFPYVFFQPKTNKPFHPETDTFQAKAIVETTCGPLYVLDNYLSNITSPIMDIIPGLLKKLHSADRKNSHNFNCCKN